MGDPSADLAGHITVYGEQSLHELIEHYQKFGGKIWPNIFEHTVERHSTSPLKYAVFALTAASDEHLAAAKAQLGVLETGQK